MKIKNIISKSIFMGCMALLASCDSYFNNTPYDFVAPQNYYNNEDECMTALAGVYSSLTSDNTFGDNISSKMNVSDINYWTRREQTGQIFANSHDTGNDDLWKTWSQLYSGINNANVLLENVDKAKMSDRKKEIIKGEARFLRAYYHFLLIRGWYEVPLRKHSVDDIVLSSEPATPYTDALDWVISEMEACIPLVDDSVYDKSPSHVKKTTVEGMLARVCLCRAGYPANGGQPFYEKAENYAKAVMDSQKHDLNPDVYALWKNMARDEYDPKYNESIWEAEFLGTRQDGIQTYGKIGNVIGNLQEDGSQGSIGYAYSFHAGTLHLWDLLGGKDSKDARRDLSMAPYKYDKVGAKIDWKEKEIVMRRCGKFRREWEKNIPRDKVWTPENWSILRYADVLLMYAEANNEVHHGPTQEAIDAVNKIRTRAGVEAISNMDYDQFQQFVRDERARELCFEGERRYDLVRWGIYVKAIHEDLKTEAESKRWSKNYFTTGAVQYADNTQEKHQFFPIPAKELAVNTKLTQNKYWK